MKEQYEIICKKYDSYITEQDYKLNDISVDDLIQRQEILQKAQKEFNELSAKVVIQPDLNELTNAIRQKLDDIQQFLARLEKLQPNATPKAETPVILQVARGEEEEENKVNQPGYIETQQKLLKDFREFLESRGKSGDDDSKAAGFLETHSISTKNTTQASQQAMRLNPEGYHFLYPEDPNVISIYRAALNKGLPVAAFRVIEACLDCELYRERGGDFPPDSKTLLTEILTQFLPIRNTENQNLAELCTVRDAKHNQNKFFNMRFGMLKSQVDVDEFDISSIITLPSAPILAHEETKPRPRSNTYDSSLFHKLFKKNPLPQPTQPPKTGYLVTKRYEHALFRESEFEKKIDFLEVRARGNFLGYTAKDLVAEYNQSVAMVNRLQEKIIKYRDDKIKYNPQKYESIINRYTRFQDRLETVKSALIKAKEELPESRSLTRGRAYTYIPGGGSKTK